MLVLDWAVAFASGAGVVPRAPLLSQPSRARVLKRQLTATAPAATDRHSISEQNRRVYEQADMKARDRYQACQEGTRHFAQHRLPAVGAASRGNIEVSQ